MVWSPIIDISCWILCSCHLLQLQRLSGSIFTINKPGIPWLTSWYHHITHTCIHRPFQFWWYFWLALTGLGLGLTVSCKWVGLFMIATVGVSTIKNLWEIWGDTRVPVVSWIHATKNHRRLILCKPIFIRHFMARAFCLIVLPITVYMIMFGIHFHSLPNSGEGNGFMSPEFQQTLAGHKLADTPIGKDQFGSWQGNGDTDESY